MQRRSNSTAGRVTTRAVQLHNPTSPATWFAAGGALLLAATFYLIVASARRTARTEERGDLLARLLLAEGSAMAPIDWNSSWQRVHLLARLAAAGAAHGLFVQDLELDRERAGFEFCYRNKHYCVVLRPSPRLSATAAAAVDGTEPLEAMAWPNSTVSPAHAVFFYPADAEAAYSRNLQFAYADDDAARRPRAGAAHRRLDSNRRTWDYRGYDDERWLLHERPRSGDARP